LVRRTVSSKALVSIFFRTTKRSWLAIESIGFDPTQGWI